MVELNRVRESDLWYVVGYITTDGNLSVDGRHINITSKDRSHLYLIRNSLFLTNKIGLKSRLLNTSKIYSYLQFGDVKFYMFLCSIGLTPKKSLTLGELKINSDYFIDFLRGVIDGDGDITSWVNNANNHIQWVLRISSASNIFLEWLNKLIELKFGIKGKIYSALRKDRNHPIYHIKFGVIAASIILCEIYYPKSLSLKRKYNQAQLCLQHRDKKVKLCR